MAASTQIWVFTGAAAGTTANIKNAELRMKRADNTTVDLANPVPIPASEPTLNYSWRKHTKLAFGTLPNEEIRNLRWYAEDKAGLGTWSGITLFVGVTPSYTQGSSSDEATQVGGTNHAQNYLVGTPLTVNSGVVLTKTTDLPNNPTGDTQDYIVLQVAVGASASSGVTQQRDVFYRMDEI